MANIVCIFLSPLGQSPPISKPAIPPPPPPSPTLTPQRPLPAPPLTPCRPMWLRKRPHQSIRKYARALGAIKHVLNPRGEVGLYSRSSA